MSPQVTYKYYRKIQSKTVYVVMHGGGAQGIESSFISDIFNSLSNGDSSVFSFNLPYCERGEESASSPELMEEMEALNDVITYLRDQQYEKIIIVAKSLGGIVTSYWLEHYPADDVDVIILGYVMGSVKTKCLEHNLQFVIQGENDRFGNAVTIKNELQKHNVRAKVFELPNADHSYRDTSKNPIYENDAIKLLANNL